MGATSRGCFCRFVVLPVVLVLIAAAIVFIIKNKVHPSSAPSVPSSPDSDKYGTALSASLQFLQIQKGIYEPCLCSLFFFSSYKMSPFNAISHNSLYNLFIYYILLDAFVDDICRCLFHPSSVFFFCLFRIY